MSRQLFIFSVILVCCVGQYTVNSTENSLICFDQYIARSVNATEQYAAKHLDCENQRTIKRAFLIKEREAEKEEVRNATAKICENLQSCNQYDDHIDFYNCHLKNNDENLDNLITIHLNASAAVIKLSSEYEEVEKEVRLCQIQAEYDYIKDTRDSLKELHTCLNA